jgi:amino acid permease
VKETFWWDYKLNKKISWALAVFVPYGFYLSGVRNLADVVSFVGAVGGGISSIVLIIIFKKLRKKKNALVIFEKKRPGKFVDLLILLFVLGIVYQVLYFLFLK